MSPALQHEILKKHAFDSPEQEAYLNIARTHAELAGPFTRLFKDRGLSQAAYNILRVLRGVRKHPEQGRDALPCGEIGGRLVTRVPDVTRLIDRLVADGLVERMRLPEDRRVVLAKITSEGMAALRALDRPVIDLHRDTLGHLTRAELKELNRLLVKARKAGE